MKLGFVGDVDASGYKVSVSSVVNAYSGEVIVPQPAGYTGGQIIDETMLNSLLGTMVEPDRYNIAIQALAPQNSSGAILDSRTATYTFRDTFAHAAVALSSIQFTRNGNSVVASWDAVPTALSYHISIVNSDQLASVAETQTNSLDITNYLTLGDNAFTIYCMANDLYTNSEQTVANCTYVYDVTGRGELQFDFDGEDTVTITIPQFDQNVTSYALQFDDRPVKYVVADATGVAKYSATFIDLPLYKTTTITVTAGVTGKDGEDWVNEPYINTASIWTTQFTNDLMITAPELEVNYDAQSGNEILTITLDADALNYTARVNWDITLDGRALYADSITEFTLDTIEIDLVELLKGSKTSVLDTGTYAINAQIFATSGITNDAITCTFDKTSKLATPTGFVKAQDNTYLQWNAVTGATEYTITAKFNGANVAGYTWITGEYIEGENEVIRLSTVDLFGDKGLGSYEFTIIAKSANVLIEQSDSAVYTWVLSNAISAPVFSVEMYNGTPHAKVLTSPLVTHYQVTVNGDTEANRSLRPT